MKRFAFLLLAVAMLAVSACNRGAQGPREFLMWSMDRHAALTSFMTKGQWQRVMQGQADAPRDRIVLYIRPNKFKVLSGVPNGFSMLTVSDGNSLAEFCTDPDIAPVGLPAPSSLATVDTPFLEDPGFGGSLLYKMFAGRSAFGELVDESKSGLEFGGSEKLPSGEPGREVNFYAKGPYGHVSMLIGEKSGMVRRIVFDREPLVQQYLASDEGKKMTPAERKALPDQYVVEQYNDIRPNADVSKENFDGKVPDGVLAAHDRAIAGPKMVGKPAPDFTLTSLDGKRKLRLKDVMGKPVFLDFWATWCGPCQLSLPKTQQIYKRNRSKAEVLAISNEKPEIIRKFLKAKKLDIPVYLDPDDKVAKLYNLNPYPTFVLIDKKGTIAEYVPGFFEDRIKKGLLKAGMS